MDILSHGLWGGVAFGRRSRRSFWLAFFIGLAPDLLSFGIFTAGTWFGFFDHPDWTSGRHPLPEAFPVLVHALYSVTHSLVVFALVFGVVWLILKRPLYELSAWGLHILIDIPTHSLSFFPTPFLWPISDFRFDGVPWSSTFIFWPNVFLLVALYVWFFVLKRRDRKNR